MTGEYAVTVRDNHCWQAMELIYMLHKVFGHNQCLKGMFEGNKVTEF